MSTHNHVFCALDLPDTPSAAGLARALAPHVGGLKVGLELFASGGPAAVEEVAKAERPIFLDLKLHDIPNTVAGAARAVSALPVTMLTVHAAGGHAMVRAAVEAAPGIAVLGVTVLTSLDEHDAQAIGWCDGATDRVARLAELALRAGAAGLVCSAHEVAAMRRRFGSEPRLVVPGIRPRQPAPRRADDDQKRTMSPAEALREGADILIIGRPITRAADPVEAVRALERELAG